VNGSAVVWGSGVVWGTTSTNGFSVVWGTGSLANASSTTLSQAQSIPYKGEPAK
jgi:hypothetical protein